MTSTNCSTRQARGGGHRHDRRPHLQPPRRRCRGRARRSKSKDCTLTVRRTSRKRIEEVLIVQDVPRPDDEEEEEHDLGRRRALPAGLVRLLGHRSRDSFGEPRAAEASRETARSRRAARSTPAGAAGAAARHRAHRHEPDEHLRAHAGHAGTGPHFGPAAVTSSPALSRCRSISSVSSCCRSRSSAAFRIARWRRWPGRCARRSAAHAVAFRRRSGLARLLFAASVRRSSRSFSSRARISNI